MDFCKRYCEEGRAILTPGASDTINWSEASPCLVSLMLALRVGDSDDMELLRCLLDLSRASNLPHSTRVFGLIRFFEEIVTLCGCNLQKHVQDRLTEYFSDGIRNASLAQEVDEADLKFIFQHVVREAFVMLLKQTWKKPSLLRIYNSAKSIEPLLRHSILAVDPALVRAMSQWATQRPADKLQILQTLNYHLLQGGDNPICTNGIEFIINCGVVEIKTRPQDYIGLEGFNEFAQSLGIDLGSNQSRQVQNRGSQPHSTEEPVRMYLNQLQERFIKGAYIETTDISSQVCQLTSKSKEGRKSFGRVAVALLQSDLQRVSELHPKVILMWRVFNKALKQLKFLELDDTVQIVKLVKDLLIQKKHPEELKVPQSSNRKLPVPPQGSRNAVQPSYSQRKPGQPNPTQPSSFQTGPPQQPKPGRGADKIREPNPRQHPRAQNPQAAPLPMSGSQSVNQLIDDSMSLSHVLSKEMIELVSPYAATSETSRNIAGALTQLRKMLNENEIQVKIGPYGSSTIGAWLVVSPLNFDISPTNPQTSLADISNLLSAKGLSPMLMSKAGREMLEVRIVNFTFQFSLKFEEGRQFATCLKEIIRGEFVQLLLFLKYWMLHCGTLNRNGHFLTLLLIHFLQQKNPPLLPPLNHLLMFGGHMRQVNLTASLPSLSSLAEEFFRFYAVQSQKVCADLRTAQPSSKESADLYAVVDPITNEVVTSDDASAQIKFRSAYQMMQSLEGFNKTLRP